MVNIGEKIPKFELQSTEGVVSSESYEGQNLILVFYPEDGTPVCTSQLAFYNEIQFMFEEHNAKILGISVDKLSTHEKFAKKLNLKFPLLSDDQPKGDLAKLFDVYDESDKKSERALIVIDKRGIMRWKSVSPKFVNPGADGILKVLEDISNASED